jgi:anti-anti-sigma factor
MRQDRSWVALAAAIHSGPSASIDTIGDVRVDGRDVEGDGSTVDRGLRRSRRAVKTHGATFSSQFDAPVPGGEQRPLLCVGEDIMSEGVADRGTRSERGRRLDVDIEHPRLIRVRGDLDHDTAPMLAGMLRPVASRGGTVKVDLAGVQTVDASGFAVLLDVARALGRRGRLVLRDPPPTIGQLMARNRGADVERLTIADGG